MISALSRKRTAYAARSAEGKYLVSCLTWYTENGMIVNPSKHYAMVLGSTDHQFSFTTKDSLDLLGMTIDSQLNFDK